MTTLGLVSFLLVQFTLLPPSKSEVQYRPTRLEVEKWLGSFQFGPETIVLKWKDGPIIVLDKIPLPIDGAWHDTVPTFSVQHRASWTRDSSGIQVEEKHNSGSHWYYRYTLSKDGDNLDKSLGTGESYQVVRTYQRIRR